MTAAPDAVGERLPGAVDVPEPEWRSLQRAEWDDRLDAVAEGVRLGVLSPEDGEWQIGRLRAERDWELAHPDEIVFDGVPAMGPRSAIPPQTRREFYEARAEQLRRMRQAEQATRKVSLVRLLVRRFVTVRERGRARRGGRRRLLRASPARSPGREPDDDPDLDVFAAAA